MSSICIKRYYEWVLQKDVITRYNAFVWVAPNGALVDSIKQRLRAIVLWRRASGIHGAVTANGRNDLYWHWHFLVRIERRFYYEILTDGAYCKIVTMPAESHEVADDVAISETRKIPTILRLYRY